MKIAEYFPRYFIIAMLLYIAVLAAGVGFIIDIISFGLLDWVFSLIIIMILLPALLLVPYVKLWANDYMRLIIGVIVVVDALFLLFVVMPLY